MRRRLIIEVTGWIRHGIMQEIEEAIVKHSHSLDMNDSQWGIHIYYYNTEGFVCHYVSNFPFPVGVDASEIAMTLFDLDGWGDLIGEGLAEVPIPFQLGNVEFYHLGGIRGYSHDSKSPRDLRYEE